MGEAILGEAVETVDTGHVRASTTTRTARLYAVATYVFVLATYSKIFGPPSDTLQVFGWMWLATIAWNVQAPRRSHLTFVRDWWPALAVLEVYLYSRGFTDDIGISVHVAEPIRFDSWLGGGQLPTQTLQQHLCGDPCTETIPPRWYDGLLTAVYYTHFVAAPTVAAVLWLRSRASWLPFMRRYVTLYVAGLFVYITFPMAPPWMASRDGYVAGDLVARITGRGWAQLGFEHVHQALSRMSNEVAAMPSLHAGTAALIAFYGITRLRSPWRFLLLAYPVTMSFLLVYYGEHYVIDIIAGWTLAGLVMWACTEWEREGSVKQLARAATGRLLNISATQPASDPVLAGVPRQRGDGGPVPTAHEQFEERSRPVLAWLARLPSLVIPCVLVGLVLVGLMASTPVAVPALALVVAFVGWVSYLSWFDLDAGGRVARALALGVLVLLSTLRVLGAF